MYLFCGGLFGLLVSEVRSGITRLNNTWQRSRGERSVAYSCWSSSVWLKHVNYGLTCVHYSPTRGSRASKGPQDGGRWGHDLILRGKKKDPVMHLCHKQFGDIRLFLFEQKLVKCGGDVFSPPPWWQNIVQTSVSKHEQVESRYPDWKGFFPWVKNAALGKLLVIIGCPLLRVWVGISKQSNVVL